MEQFALTDDQRAIIEAVRRVVKEKVEPRAKEIDEKGEYPWDLKELFAEMGFLGADIPEEYDGQGQGLLTSCLITEEIAKACASSSLIVAGQELGFTPLKIGGSDELKKKYLPKFASGEFIPAFGLTEPNAGSDAGGMTTKAVRDGNQWVLNGSKCFITNGGIADVYTIFAKTTPGDGVKGISAFLVEKDAPGLSIGKHENKMGIRGSLTTDVIMDDCRIPAQHLVGELGAGFGIAMATLDRTRPCVAAQALGIAEGALDFAINYMKERKQFGKPIATFQGLQFMVAELATEIESAKYLLYKAASIADAESKAGRVRLSSEAGKLSAMCKLKCGDVAMRVTTDAVQLCGGYGYIREYPLERMMRDAKITQIYEGTNQVQRVVIGSHIFR
jgi:alkylation response protein AidB-like acyl-CoA dehydrogenase